MKSVVLLALFGVAMVAAAEVYQALDISERGFGPLRDGSSVLNGDTPVRQAQRERREERSVAADEDVAGFSLLEASSAAGSARYAGANGPALDRLTGASKTFHPNDQMCVMCQFLVQRTQLDMAHFNVLGGFTGIKAAGANGAGNAAAGGGDAGAKAATEEGSFLEIGTAFGADDESADWAAKDAEEAAAMEIAAKEELAEADGDWDAVSMLEQKAHSLDTVVEEMEAEAGDEDEDEADDEAEEQEGAEFEEEDTEAGVASKLAAASFSETASTIVTEGLTAQEQAEMQEVAAEMRDDKIAASVNKQLSDGLESTTVMVESQAAAKADIDSDEEMNADEVEVAPEALANSASSEDEEALAQSFDNEMTLDSDEEADLVASMQGKEKDSEEEADWSSPAYNADGSAAAMSEDSETVTAIDADHEDEDMALLQVDATEQNEVDDEITADAEADEEAEGTALNVQLIETAANPGARRSYARVMHTAEHAPVEPVLAEVSGQHAAFQSAGGLARVATRDCRRKVQRIKRCQRIEPTKRRCKIIRRKAPKPSGCGEHGTLGVANSPRRFRLADALHSRPRWNRWDPTVKPHPDPARAKAREMWHHLMQMTYDRLEGYCSTRLPEQFTPFCRPLLRRFRVVAEGIRYGDRPNQICMRTRFCPRGSYVRRSPHNVFKHINTNSVVVYSH